MFGRMCLYMCFFTIITLISQQSMGSKLPDMKVFGKILSSLKGSGSDENSDVSSHSSDSSDSSHSSPEYDLEDYIKYSAKQERKLTKKEIRDRISEEDKAQVKYFEDMLKQIKQLNKKTA